MAAVVASAAPCSKTPRPEALAAMPVLAERAALAATLLEVTAVTGVAAVTAVTLMALARLVAMAATEAVTAARRLEDLAAPEEMAALVATAASWSSTPRSAAMAAIPVV